MADIALYSPWCPNLIARRLGSGEPETVCAQVLRSAIINCNGRAWVSRHVID